MSTSTGPKRELLRHAVATLAYRGGKALRGAPSEFSDFHAGPTTRTPGQILAHIGDLLDWALSIAKGKQQWQDSKPLPWNQQVDRFFAGERLPCDDRIDVQRVVTWDNGLRKTLGE